MSGDAGTSWIPWRGANRIRWTLAIAICVLAIVVAAQPQASWTSGLQPFVAPAAIVALVIAAFAGPRQRFVWPWRGPDPARNTVAFFLPQLALAIFLIDSTWRGGEVTGAGWTRTQLVIAMANTLLFAAAVASTLFGPWLRWLNRVAWGLFSALAWWQWWSWSLRG